MESYSRVLLKVWPLDDAGIQNVGSSSMKRSLEKVRASNEEVDRNLKVVQHINCILQNKSTTLD